jgi:two-component system LytT family response regulator
MPRRPHRRVTRLRVLIVDDEPLARRRLARLLKHEADVVVVGECGDGESAVSALERLTPDLLLLDVQLPGMDGLAVLDAARPARSPAVVFVTAYDRYAVQAFEREAVDYLVKPVDGERLRSAVARARRRLGRHGRNDLTRALGALPNGKPAERLLVMSRGRGVFVRVAEIEWIEARGNTVHLHAAGVVHRLRGPLARLHERLDPERFRRVSRSAVVNLDHVKEIEPWFHGDAVILLESGRKVRLSRRYRRQMF